MRTKLQVPLRLLYLFGILLFAIGSMWLIDTYAVHIDAETKTIVSMFVGSFSAIAVALVEIHIFDKD